MCGCAKLCVCTGNLIGLVASKKLCADGLCVSVALVGVMCGRWARHSV